MTSPVSAIEAIEKAMEGPAALIERDVLNELAKHRTATGTVCSPQFNSKFGDKIPLFALFPSAISEVLALARQAEALKREIAEKDARIADLEEALKPVADKYTDITPTAQEVQDGARHPDRMADDDLALITIGIGHLRLARALLSKESADDRG